MATLTFKYELGSKARDRVTTYQGIIIACTKWLHGCNRYVIQSQELKDGKPVEAQSIDEDALELIEEGAIQHNPRRETGGPGDMPARPPSVSR